MSDDKGRSFTCARPVVADTQYNPGGPVGSNGRRRARETPHLSRHTVVFGPAYLDRVLRVGGPLLGPESGPPLDQSVEGAWAFGEGLRLVDDQGSVLHVELP